MQNRQSSPLMSSSLSPHFAPSITHDDTQLWAQPQLSYMIKVREDNLIEEKMEGAQGSGHLPKGPAHICGREQRCLILEHLAARSSLFLRICALTFQVGMGRSQSCPCV